MSAQADGPAIKIGNAHMERTFSVCDNVFRSDSIVNRGSDARLTMDSCEFRILFLDGSELTGLDFAFCGHESAETSDGAKTLTVRLEHAPLAMHSEIVYTLGPDDFYVRKQLTLTADKPSAQPVDRLDVECFSSPTPADAALEHQPLFIGDDFFLGLEFPGCVNVVEGDCVRTSHFPGVPVGKDPLASKRAVLGVAVTGDLFEDFLTYVDRIRRKNPPVVMWNSGGVLQIYEPVQLPKESQDFMEVLTGALDELQTNLTVKRNVNVHAYVLEPAWYDESTLYKINEKKFPGGLAPLAKKLQKTGSRLGLWLSPTTPLTRGHMTKKLMEDNRYALAVNPKHRTRYPCLSFPRYFQDIKAVMRRHARDLKLGHYKMDFSYVICEGEGHGHLPNARHGREANINALIDIMQALAAENPELRVVPTSGMWLSPWWLMYADVIWPHGMMDFNYCRVPVSVNPRHWEITLRDQEFHRLLREERGRFPFSGMLYMGMGAGPRYNIAGPNETRESYLRTVIYNMSRQLKCPQRYAYAPPSGLDEDWDVVAQALRWSLDRHNRVPDGEVILGQPARAEVYGFRNLSAQGGVVVLRNPDMRPQKATVPIETLDEKAQFMAEVVSPYRKLLGIGRKRELEASLQIKLAPYEAVVVEIVPSAEARGPIPVGCKYALVEEKPGKVVLDVFANAGEPLECDLFCPTKVTSCEVDGAPIKPGGKLVIPAKGAEEHLSIRHLTDRGASKVNPSMKSYRVDIPDSHQATVRILAEEEELRPLTLVVNMGGFFGGLPFKVCKGEGWTAYDVDLDPRDMNVIGWGFPPDDAPAVAKMWLVRRWELRKTRVRIGFDPVAAGLSRPEMPTPFAGVVWDAVCVTDVAPEQGDELLPWTDEYAEESDA